MIKSVSSQNVYFPLVQSAERYQTAYKNEKPVDKIDLKTNKHQNS